MGNFLPIDENEYRELMDRYGILCVPTNQYHYKNYRYSNIVDAIAQARRDEVPESI